MIYSEAVEAGARVLDPEAFELPLRGYTERAAGQARADARRMSRKVLEAAERASVPVPVDGQVV